MKSVKYYDFNLSAGGTQVILAEGEYFRVQSATGSVTVMIEGVGEIPSMLNGQGIKDTPFKRLVLKDTSGATNTGFILVASKEFIDNRTYGINDLSTATLNTITRPMAATGYFNSSAIVAANTATNVFTAGSNINGAIVLSASALDYSAAQNTGIALIGKATAPATPVDGEPIFRASYSAAAAGSVNQGGIMPAPQFVPAGVGLWWIADTASTATGFRACRFKLL